MRRYLMSLSVKRRITYSLAVLVAVIGVGFLTGTFPKYESASSSAEVQKRRVQSYLDTPQADQADSSSFFNYPYAFMNGRVMYEVSRELIKLFSFNSRSQCKAFAVDEKARELSEVSKNKDKRGKWRILFSCNNPIPKIKDFQIYRVENSGLSDVVFKLLVDNTERYFEIKGFYYKRLTDWNVDDTQGTPDYVDFFYIGSSIDFDDTKRFRKFRFAYKNSLEEALSSLENIVSESNVLKAEIRTEKSPDGKTLYFPYTYDWLGPEIKNY
jgi:hypothetical protein